MIFSEIGEFTQNTVYDKSKLYVALQETENGRDPGRFLGRERSSVLSCLVPKTSSIRQSCPWVGSATAKVLKNLKELF